MVFEYDFEKLLADHKRTYKDFLLPVIVCDANFEARWWNSAANDLYPQYVGEGGVRRLLGEFDSRRLLAKLKRDGMRRVDGLLALAGGHLNLMPVMKDGEAVGMIIMIVGPQAVRSPLEVIESSRTPENIEASIRAGVAEIFEIMDESAKKADWIGDGIILPSFAGIERSGYRLLRIAANISGYTRFQLDPPRPAAAVLDVAQFIRKSQAAISEFGDETGIVTSFELPGEKEAAVAAIDPNHLQLAYSNLLNNAFYYTKPGNAVHIRIGAGRDEISVTVRDKGVGIPAKVLPHVCKPYYSYAREGKPAGVGLGLALVDMIAKGCGGKFSIESAENEWTEATLTLPNRAFGASLSFRQDTAETRPDGYGDRFSYASVSLRAAADSPYRQE